MGAPVYIKHGRTGAAQDDPRYFVPGNFHSGVSKKIFLSCDSLDSKIFVKHNRDRVALGSFIQ